MYKTINPRTFCMVATLYYLANAYILGSDRVAGRSAWLCILISALLYLPVFYLYGQLTKKYPGKDLFGIVDSLYGRRGRILLSAVYLVYAIFVLSMSLNNFARFVSSNILPDTPKYVMAIVVAVCAGYLVRKGIVVMGRWVSFVLPVVLLFIALSIIGSIPSMHLSELLPLVENRDHLVLGTWRSLAFPFGEPILLFTLLSGVNGEIRTRHWLLPWGLASLILLFAYARNTMVLGGALSGLLSFSTNHADSITGYSTFSQRIEVVTSLIPAAAGIMEASVILHFAVQGVKALTGKNESWPGILICAAAALAISSFVYRTNAVLEQRTMIWPMISLPLQAALPLLFCLTYLLQQGVQRKKFARRLKRQRR